MVSLNDNLFRDLSFLLLLLFLFEKIQKRDELVTIRLERLDFDSLSM